MTINQKIDKEHIKIIEDSTNVWKVIINTEFVNIYNYFDENWNSGKFGFYQNVSDDYPYTISPKTSDAIYNLSKKLVNIICEKNVNFSNKEWSITPEEGSYIHKLLHRDKVPDTYTPIFWNTNQAVDFIKNKNQKDLINVRFFGTGVAVAEKSFLARLNKDNLNLNINLITTDKSINSIAAGCVNIAYWNESLLSENKFDIFIIKGDIPKEFYYKNQIIIFQIEDIEKAINNELEKSIKYTYFSLDNILPYLSKNLNIKIFDFICLNSKNNKNLMVSFLGLDKNIEVKINKYKQFVEILKSIIINLRSQYYKLHKENFYPINNGYWHFYKFYKNDHFIITQVFSEGSALIYSWIGRLIKNFKIKKAKNVINAISFATSLSSARKLVITSPFESHEIFIKELNKRKIKHSIIEKPLDYKYFNFTKESKGNLDEVYYYKGNKKFSDSEMMKYCQNLDPLVLRSSIFILNN